MPAKDGIGLLFWAALGLTSCPSTVRADFPIGGPGNPPVVVHADHEQFKVYANHPRLFFRDTDLPTIRARVQGEFRDAWNGMTGFLDGRLLRQDPAKYSRNPYLKAWSYGRNMAFAAMVAGDTRYRDWALRWADCLAAADPKLDTVDDDYRGRLMSLAVAYDWLYPWLSDARKASYAQAIAAHIDRNWYFAEKPDFISGHSRWGNFSLAAGLLAVITERPELEEELLRVRENWLFGYHPAQAWIAVDGGYHMAWTYSAPYTDARNHCVWSSATNECVYYPWRAQIPYLFLYGNLGDGAYPNSGDAYSWKGGLVEGADTLAVAAGIFKNRHAAWMLKPSWDCFYELLYGDKSVQPLAPDDPQEPLPLARHFRRAGVVVMRDRWDDRTTHLAFKSSSFYSANHHHRDENAFTLSYRGPLAIDSGYYDAYGSQHWRNYYTRTIAHNAITVFDPRQEFRVYGKAASNDGGQPFGQEPTKVEDIQPGGLAALDGIGRFEHREAFDYAMGNATKAYDPQHVKLAEREIVYLRDTSRPHPVVVVFDRVESADPSFEKSFLLHTANRPSIEENRCVAENGGGRLTSLTLLPKDAELRLLGGPGKEFTVNGVNYPPERLSGPWKSIAGAWRVEVRPRQRQKLDYFLHVLLVDDIEAPPVDPPSVKLIEGDGCVGVEAGGWAVVFPLHRDQASSLSYTTTGQLRRHLVVGCPVGQTMRYTIAAAKPVDCTTGNGGCAMFDAPQGQRSRVRISY